MSTWNYRITREIITNPDGTTEAMYACREVHYDDAGKVTSWSAEPTTFVGETPGEVCEDLLRAAGSFGVGVLDLDTRQTVRVTQSDYRINEDGQVEWLQHKAAQGELPESAQLALDVIKLRAQVNAVRALHRRVTISEDWGDEVQCTHCVDGDGNGHLWPCLTAKALGVAP